MCGVVMELRFTADPAVWAPDLGQRIRAHLERRHILLWRSVSGAVLSLANVGTRGGVDVVGIRNNPYDPFDTDGLPLVLGRIDATSCGLWSPTGYRSSRPVTVHVLERADDADGVVASEDWQRTLRAIADKDAPHAWLEQVPDGHPREPCPVAHCPVVLNGRPISRPTRPSTT